MTTHKVMIRLAWGAVLVAAGVLGGAGPATADGIVCGSGHVLWEPIPVEQCGPPCPGVWAEPVSAEPLVYLYVCVRP